MTWATAARLGTRGSTRMALEVPARRPPPPTPGLRGRSPLSLELGQHRLWFHRVWEVG